MPPPPLSPTLRRLRKSTRCLACLVPHQSPYWGRMLTERPRRATKSSACAGTNAPAPKRPPRPVRASAAWCAWMTTRRTRSWCCCPASTTSTSPVQRDGLRYVLLPLCPALFAVLALLREYLHLPSLAVPYPVPFFLSHAGPQLLPVLQDAGVRHPNQVEEHRTTPPSRRRSARIEHSMGNHVLLPARCLIAQCMLQCRAKRPIVMVFPAHL
jgi:hypothetical protein